MTEQLLPSPGVRSLSQLCHKARFPFSDRLHAVEGAEEIKEMLKPGTQSKYRKLLSEAGLNVLFENFEDPFAAIVPKRNNCPDTGL